MIAMAVMMAPTALTPTVIVLLLVLPPPLVVGMMPMGMGMPGGVVVVAHDDARAANARGGDGAESFATATPGSMFERDSHRITGGERAG